MRRIATTSLLLGLMVVMSGCIFGPREGYHEGYHEGYYDHAHNRYYHKNSWHDCGERERERERDEHCH